MVFVGGAVSNLLLTDPAAPPVRATKDVDVAVEVASRLELSRLEAKLRSRGFSPAPGGPVCRWQDEGVILDVMPTDPSILGFGNVWFEEAVRTATDQPLSTGRTIRLIAAPVFVATKLEAFKDRGQDDLLASHDLEDLIILVDGRESIVDEVESAGEELKLYLSREMRALLSAPGFEDAVVGHMPQDDANQARAPEVLRRLRLIAGS